MPDNELALFAHLMRRAGFGATRAELEELSSKSYDQVVDDLVHPDRFPDIDEDVLKRYYPELMYTDALGAWVGHRDQQQAGDDVDDGDEDGQGGPSPGERSNRMMA